MFQNKSWIGNSEPLVIGFTGFYIFMAFSFKSNFTGHDTEEEKQ